MKINNKIQIYKGEQGFRTMYTVRRITNDDIFYGPSHASCDGYETVCGIEFDHHWYITSNSFDGSINCKKCNKILENHLKSLEHRQNP